MSWIASHARQRRCFTNIRVRMVSGFKLARRSDIVSLPPEKIHSTATADPGYTLSNNPTKEFVEKHTPGIERMSRASRDRLGNCACRLAHHWIGSHLSKLSSGNLKYSSSSSTNILA